MQLKKILQLPDSKYRLWAIFLSLGLGFSGVFLGLSISASFLNPGTFLSLPGSFLARSYGTLAFIIPAWLLFAAVLLADPSYKPERIFILCGTVVPFFTLALGFFWIREFDSVRMNSNFISGIGRTGLGILTVFVSSLQVFLIIKLCSFLFKKTQQPENEKTASKTPLNVNMPKMELYPQENRSKKLKDIYAEAAAAMSFCGTEYPAAPPKTTNEAPEPTAAKAKVFPDELLLPAEIEELAEEVSKPASLYPRTYPADDLEELSAADDELSPDVEKALAEAAAHADTIAAEEAAKHGGKKFTQSIKKLPYFVPVEGILKQYPDGEYWVIDEETREAALTLKETFKEFNIQVEVTGIRKGPVITMFEILPAPGIRLTKIESLADNIALRLAAQSVRIVAPIPGKHAVGIEVPNVKRNIVSFREIIEGEMSRTDKKPEVPMVLGKDITGEAVTVDLVQMPHLLIAGATGSGKSVCVNAMILSILYQKPPTECRLILIDPKIVELKLYNDIPHLLTPVITEPKKAFQALQYCIYEMERRYSCLDSLGVRDIRSYNRRIKERSIAAEHMPYIVVVIDEFADLMATTGKELESTVARLAAMSRAVGIHLVLATQRPSIDVITGLIKANIPSRIAFMVASKMDSRIIIDMVGAEKLLGKGDMLYSGTVDPFPTRMQGAFVSEEEVERVVDYVKSLGEPDYIDEEIFFDDEDEEADPSLFSEGEDPLYEKALEIVMQQGKASASYIQRRLKIGYNRAARLVEVMEHYGVVGPAQGSKPREVLRGA